MLNTYLSILIVLSTLVPVFSQTSSAQPNQFKCSLTQSPVIRGIRLGMTTDEALAVLPPGGENQINQRAIALPDRPPHFGVARLAFRPINYAPSVVERFAGVNSISITLLDGLVVDLTVSYFGPNTSPRGPYWNSIDDFITKLSEAFGLPESRYWQYKFDSLKALNCSTFSIEATIQSHEGSLRLHSNGYEDKVNQRAAAEEERLRREFKP